MTGTTEALSGSAAVDNAARSVTRPFYVYAVLTNSLFQRGVFVIGTAAGSGDSGVMQSELRVGS
jgi:hypothetical protein